MPVVLGFTGLAAPIAFAFAESRVRDALIDPKLLRHNRFRAATVGSLALGSGVTATVSFVPTLVGLGSGLCTASVLVVAWSGTSMATANLTRHIRHPMQGPTPIATSLVIVAVGQALGYGLNSESSPWRLVPSLVVAAMGSGANNTARYFGAAVGITPDSHSRNAFVVSSRKTALGCESRNRGVRPDSERNCVSNIHPPDGLGYDLAAHVLVSLLAARRNWAALAWISRTARQS